MRHDFREQHWNVWLKFYEPCIQLTLRVRFGYSQLHFLSHHIYTVCKDNVTNYRNGHVFWELNSTDWSGSNIRVHRKKKMRDRTFYGLVHLPSLRYTELSFVFASNSIWATLQIWFYTWRPSALIMTEWCLNSLCLSVNLRWDIYKVLEFWFLWF